MSNSLTLLLLVCILALTLFVVALALSVWLLWSPANGWRLAWPQITGVVVTVVIWFLIARWIHQRQSDLLFWWARCWPAQC